jgi:uncharacterized protein YqfA (UPF0365 family)
MSPQSGFAWGVVATIAGLLLVWWLLRVLSPWLMARASGVPLSMMQVVGMRMRRSDAGLIAATAIAFSKLGEEVPVLELEVAYLTLPESQRTMTDLMRSVRPELVAQLEARAKLRSESGKQ